MNLSSDKAVKVCPWQMSIFFLLPVAVQTFLVAGLGRDAVFTCISSSAVVTNVEWLINGRSLNGLQLSNVDQGFEPVSGVGSLRFRNVSVEYNNTVVQCIANTSSQRQISSRNSKLLIQGNYFC